MFEEALQIAEKRREAKGKGEKERDTHLNAELQRLDMIECQNKWMEVHGIVQEARIKAIPKKNKC